MLKERKITGAEMNSEIFNRLADTIALAKSLGATDVSISYVSGVKLAASVRMDKVENIEEATNGRYLFTVYAGQSSFSGNLSSTREKSLKLAIEQGVSAARASPANPYAGLASPDQIVKTFQNLDLYDPSLPEARLLIDAARAAESSALSQNRIINSKGASSSWSRNESWVMSTNGFMRHNRRTANSTSVSIIAGENGKMETDYAYSSAVHRSDLRAPGLIGMEAAQRAAAKLNATSPLTGEFPIIFAPRVGDSLLDSFTDAIWGDTIARGSSFLKSSMDQRIFSPGVTIIDNPFVNRGLGSRNYDGDALPVRKTAIVEDGILKTWLLSLESARQLGLAPTGHSGGTSNLTIEPGVFTPEDLMADIRDGFYVTGLMGHGANIINGAFSQGASGQWIKNGKITERAISEATIAGDLSGMFMRMTPANDLKRMDKAMAVPTLRIDGMTIGGS